MRSSNPRPRPPTARRTGFAGRAFLVGLTAKGLMGLIEILAGLSLLSITPIAVTRLVGWLTSGELGELLPEATAAGLVHTVGALTAAQLTFAAVYLLIHGLLKLGLVAGLIRRILWVYPVAIAVLGGFVGYQSYEFARTGSVALVVLSVLDLVVMALAWREYRSERRHRRLRPSHLDSIALTDRRPHTRSIPERTCS